VVAASSATIGSISVGSKIEKPRLSASAAASSRTIARPKLWNVDIETAEDAAEAPACFSAFCARSRISRAALFVNVIATIFDGSTPRSTRCATFAVMTRVLPLPAPASTSSGASS